MKIETSIKPRRNGTLNVVTPCGQVIVFSAQDGRLTAEVADAADVQFLLGMSDFLPADEDDFAMASALIRGEAGSDDAGDDLPDDDGDENAAPVETATAPKPGKYTKKPK
jgi:hypothetical protein